MRIDTNLCPICLSPVSNNIISERNTYAVECERCGKYEITEDALHLFQGSELETKILSLSYWIRHHQEGESRICIELILMRKLLVPFKPPKPKEQADNLLRWIGSTLKKPDEQASKHYSHLISVVGAVDASNINYIANYLHKQEYIIIQTSSNNALFANMTFKGWDRFDELEKSSKDSRLAFMAMKFGNVTLDKIFSTVIKDVVAKTGFEIRRLDEEKRAGLIDDKLRVEIRRSKFLIADLTDNNNGAYWEAGYAEGLGMPVIYVCEESKFNTDKPHFDTNHHLTVLWKDDVESLRIFADELKATIRATLLSDAKMED